MGSSLGAFVACLCFGWIFSWDVVAQAYVPGVSPTEYNLMDPVELKVNSLTSIKSQLPYSYYYLPFCRPAELTSHISSLGEMLIGDTLQNSAYDIKMLQNQKCRLLCRSPMSKVDAALFKQMIDDEYIVNWLSDGLPALFFHQGSTISQDDDWYSLGYPLGWKEGVEDGHLNYYLYNYISIFIKYRRTSNVASPKYQIVGFEVLPLSFKESGTDSTADCSPLASFNSSSGSAYEKAVMLRQSVPTQLLQDLDDINSISFLYDVEFIEVDTPYSQRWDSYMESQRVGLGSAGMEVHWFSIVNSLVVVLVLSGIVATILIRALHKDISKYNELLMNAEDKAEEFGWKLVHGDVFRKPQHSTILAALTGSGIQILGMVVSILLIATVGVGLYPPTGFGFGRLLQCALFLWSIMGIVGGYTAARFYKLFQSPNWKMTTIRTAVMFPGVVFGIFFLCNMFLRINQSSAAVPFSGIFMLMLLWIGVSTPLIFVGAYFGFKKPAISIPIRINKIPRQVPAQPWTVNPVLTCLAGGALPFGAIFTELMFLFSSIWQHRTYMLFGLLLIVVIILIITCAEIAITMTYFQLVCEDYYWWWRAFMTAGSSAFYVFLYSIVYLTTRLNLSHFMSVSLYLGYSVIISYTFFILSGSIGFIACFLFVRAIYGSIRVD